MDFSTQVTTVIREHICMHYSNWVTGTPSTHAAPPDLFWTHGSPYSDRRCCFLTSMHWSLFHPGTPLYSFPCLQFFTHVHLGTHKHDKKCVFSRKTVLGKVRFLWSPTLIRKVSHLHGGEEISLLEKVSYNLVAQVHINTANDWVRGVTQNRTLTFCLPPRLREWNRWYSWKTKTWRLTFEL